MTDIQIQLSEDQVQNVIRVLRNVEKSEESVFKTAINNTAKRSQRLLARQVNKVYGGEAPTGVLGRSTIEKATVSNLGVTIRFHSTQPDITKFRVSASGMSPTPVAWSNGERLKFPISVQQLKQDPLKELGGNNGMAFAVRFSNGKLAIVMRTGKKSSMGKDQLKMVMGSSDRSMVRNEKVYGAVEGDMAKILNEQCQKTLERALEGGKR